MKHHWLRWTVPPSISLLVHAGLIGLVAFIGMRISATGTGHDRPAITELALPEPPNVPEQRPASTPSKTSGVSKPKPLPAAALIPDLVATQADALSQPGVDAAPSMDPVSLEAVRARTASLVRPESAAPPSVRFAGVQSRAARTLVYVVDGSGATANSFAYLQAQLLRSIDRLSPTQRFQVVLFREQGDERYSMAPINDGRLARATPAHANRVRDWLGSVSSRGRSNPLDGLEAALRLHPDLVLLITRSIQRTEMGWAQGQREILASLNELNPADDRGHRRTVIKAVQLLDDDPTGIMRAIGTLHGDGQDDYRVIRYDDLIKPDEPEEAVTRSIGASDEQRISAAVDLLGTLSESGTGLSVLYSVADETQRERTIQASRRIHALMGPLAQRDGRAALIDAQALILLAKASPGDVDRQRLQGIVDELGSLMYTDPITDAQRVLSVAMAQSLLGTPEFASGAVMELLNEQDDLGIDDTTYAAAVLTLISLGDEPDGLSDLARRSPFVTPTGNIDALWGLLLREAISLHRLNTHAEQAWSPMLAIRSAASSNPQIVGYIDSRIALLYQHAGFPDDAPVEVLMAAAGSDARSIATRERALSLYQKVSGESQDPALIADSLWQIGVLARAMNTPESIEISNRALTDLARNIPDDPRALGAISSAIGASDGSKNQQELIDRLTLAVEHYAQSPAINLWRLRLGEMLEGFARLDALDPITPGTREGVLAGELYEQTVLGMLDQYDSAQTRLGLSVRMRDAAVRFGLGSAPMWTKRVAINEVALDPQAALSTIDQLIAQARSDEQPSEELEMLRAQTLLRLGQRRTAFSSLRELSSRIDASGTRTSTYWQSWALMLESVADEGNRDDRSTALGHIARLELIDPQLGGSPWKQRIQRAKETLHSDP